MVLADSAVISESYRGDRLGDGGHLGGGVVRGWVVLRSLEGT